MEERKAWLRSLGGGLWELPAEASQRQGTGRTTGGGRGGGRGSGEKQGICSGAHGRSGPWRPHDSPKGMLQATQGSEGVARRQGPGPW